MLRLFKLVAGLVVFAVLSEDGGHPGSLGLKRGGYVVTTGRDIMSSLPLEHSIGGIMLARGWWWLARKLNPGGRAANLTVTPFRW